MSAVTGTQPNARSGIEQWFLRVQLSAELRTRIYEMLALLLENRVLLIDAMAEMYGVYSDGGKRPKNPAAMMLNDCRNTVSEGHSFATAIQPWVAPEEAALIGAGEASGDLRGAFGDAMRLIAAKKAMIGAVVGGAAYPLALVGLIAALLHIVATRLVPSLIQAAPAESWTGAAAVMYGLATFTTDYGVLTVVVLVGLGVGTVLSLPKLTGNMRYRLERIPPWSLYRTVMGATFLLTVAVMIRAGIKLSDALDLMLRTANPYMRERIDAAIRGVAVGHNLGEALEDAEFDFPDREAIRLVRVLANRDGFDRALTNYAEAWLARAIQKVQAIMKVFFMVAIIAVGAIAVVIVAAGTDIQDAIQANSNR